MKIAKAKLTIGGKTFETGDPVTTPEGQGTVVGLDPFADEEIGVRLACGDVAWFAFQAVDPVNPPERLFTCGACGRETAILANGIGPCCFGKD
jgi:hypothetical protein